MAPKLDDDLIKSLAALVRNGLSLNAAAKVMGLNPRSLLDWVMKGENGDGPEPYASLAIELNKGLGTLEAEAVQSVLGAMRTNDVKAAQFILERRFKDDWGPPRDGTVAIHGDVQVVQIQWPGHDRLARAELEAATAEAIEDAEVIDG